MFVNCFLDTNILVYAVDHSPENKKKQATAKELIRTRNFGLSAQVLQEFYVTVTRKFQTPLSPEKAIAFLDRLSLFDLIPTDYELIQNGIYNSIRFQLSYWDGTILAAAERSGAQTLFSEDLNHNQRYGTITVLNPFIGEDS